MSQTKRPAPFVLLASNQGTLIVNRNDYRMMDAATGYGVGYQLFNQSCFDPEEVGLAVKLLELRHQHFGDGVVGLDCGANLGVHTIEWARALYGRGTVIAIEAQERIFYSLAGNIAINNCFNASAIHAAVGAQDGFLDIPVPDYLKPSSFGSLELRQSGRSEFIGQALDPKKKQRIRLMAIDSLQLERLDFIKIDVEGMEMEALAGAQKAIARCRPIMLIEQIKTDQAGLLALLGHWGYRVISMGINVLAVHGSDPTGKQLFIQPAAA